MSQGASPDTAIFIRNMDDTQKEGRHINFIDDKKLENKYVA